jgi:hypothetical protein
VVAYSGAPVYSVSGKDHPSPNRLVFLYKDKDIPDPKVPGRSFFALNHKDVFEKEMTYVQKGYLSDKPRIDYYLELPTRPGQPQVWRSCRTTSPLEGFHLHLRRLTDPSAKGKSSIISVVRVGLRIFRWNIDTAVKWIHTRPWPSRAVALGRSVPVLALASLLQTIRHPEVTTLYVPSSHRCRSTLL